MVIKKVNAVLGLLSIVFMIIHIGYSVFCYLTMYYNEMLKMVTAVPFMVLVCLHAICGMSTLFFNSDGTRMNLYPKKNMGTILQRLCAALMFPLLILHLFTFNIMKNAAGNGNMWVIYLMFVVEILFFACVITHVVISLSKGLVTLGLLTSPSTQKTLDRVMYIIGAVVFVIAVYAIISGQIGIHFH